MATTRLTYHLNAPRAAVYRALLDPQAIAKWRVPTGMTSHIHSFDAREGGTFRVSLTYDLPTTTGKTTSQTDTYHGHFQKLIPNEQIVEVIEFESDKPDLQGQMTITTTLTDASPSSGPSNSATTLHATHEGLPPGVRPEDNEAGWKDSLSKLAAYLQSRQVASSQ